MHGAKPRYINLSILMLNNPEHTSIIKKTSYVKCNINFKEVRNYKRYKRQVFDLPVLPIIEVTEFVSYSKKCHCFSHKNPSLFPSNVTNITNPV